MNRFRRKRFQLFFDLMQINNSTTIQILDSCVQTAYITKIRYHRFGGESPRGAKPVCQGISPSARNLATVVPDAP